MPPEEALTSLCSVSVLRGLDNFSRCAPMSLVAFLDVSAAEDVEAVDQTDHRSR